MHFYDFFCRLKASSVGVTLYCISRVPIQALVTSACNVACSPVAFCNMMAVSTVAPPPSHSVRHPSPECRQAFRRSHSGLQRGEIASALLHALRVVVERDHDIGVSRVEQRLPTTDVRCRARPRLRLKPSNSARAAVGRDIIGR